MSKKLPSVFANSVSELSAHNKTVSYGSKIENNGESTIPSYQKINNKINSIFNSPKYVYKADVEINLKNENIKRKIIGRNNMYLVTMDNELIPIADIIDIKMIN